MLEPHHPTLGCCAVESDKRHVFVEEKVPQFTPIPVIFAGEVQVALVDMDVADVAANWFQINDLPCGSVD